MAGCACLDRSQVSTTTELVALKGRIEGLIRAAEDAAKLIGGSPMIHANLLRAVLESV